MNTVHSTVVPTPQSLRNKYSTPFDLTIIPHKLNPTLKLVFDATCKQTPSGILFLILSLHHFLEVDTCCVFVSTMNEAPSSLYNEVVVPIILPLR
jgi:hypothetical protein